MINKQNNTNKLHIVSCAYIVPLKRIDLILETVLQNPNLTWTHFGGGEELEGWTERIKREKAESRIFLKGNCTKKQMSKEYSKSLFDVFLNVSTTEGVPVSIMEAMSAGLPIIATNVGGTSELVSSTNGILINKKLNIKVLDGILNDFMVLNSNVKAEMAKNSLSKFYEMCDLDKNVKGLIISLKSMTKV